jgi:hypothetical protein
MYNCCMNTRSEANRVKSTFALSEHAKSLLKEMSESMGISMTAVLEILIRRGIDASDKIP